MNIRIYRNPDSISLPRGGIVPAMWIDFYPNPDTNEFGSKMTVHLNESSKVMVEGVDKPWLEVVEWFNKTKKIEVEVTTDEEKYNHVEKIDFRRYGD